MQHFRASSVALAVTSLLVAATPACKSAEPGPEKVDVDTPQTYGHCGEALEDCSPAPNTFGGCNEYYTEYDALNDVPTGPWWAVCQPRCEDDADCPIPNAGTVAPVCSLDGGDGKCARRSHRPRDTLAHVRKDISHSKPKGDEHVAWEGPAVSQGPAPPLRARRHDNLSSPAPPARVTLKAS